MIRSVDDWRQIMQTEYGMQLANILLSDLLGYRINSLSRADDAAQIYNFVSAVEQETIKRCGR